MVTAQKQYTAKSPNGGGITAGFSIQFDLTDPAQARAHEVARRLALPHGRRKDLIVQFLNALADYEGMTGRQAHADTIGAAMIANALAGRSNQAAATSTPALAPTEIAISSAGKSEAEEQSKRFEQGLSGRFAFKRRS